MVSFVLIVDVVIVVLIAIQVYYNQRTTSSSTNWYQNISDIAFRVYSNSDIPRAPKFKQRFPPRQLERHLMCCGNKIRIPSLHFHVYFVNEKLRSSDMWSRYRSVVESSQERRHRWCSYNNFYNAIIFQLGSSHVFKRIDYIVSCMQCKPNYAPKSNTVISPLIIVIHQKPIRWCRAATPPRIV